MEVTSVSFMGKPTKVVTKKIVTTVKEVVPEVKDKAKDLLAEEMSVAGRINRAFIEMLEASPAQKSFEPSMSMYLEKEIVVHDKVPQIVKPGEIISKISEK